MVREKPASRGVPVLPGSIVDVKTLSGLLDVQEAGSRLHLVLDRLLQPGESRPADEKQRNFP